MSILGTQRRRNNCCESFHSLLNGKVGHSHPKISILIKVLQEIAINNFDVYMKKRFLPILKRESHGIDENYIYKQIEDFVSISQEFL